MHFLKFYKKKIINHDLVNKFKYKNNQKIPEIEKIILNFGCKNFNIQKFATTLLALEIIATKKSSVTIAKSTNIMLKIQKGHPAGCKVVLRKQEIYTFLTRLFLEILPQLKNFMGFKFKKDSNFSFILIGDKIVLQEFEDQYPLFANLPNLDINISTNSKNQKELLFLIQSLKLPIFV